MSTDPNWKPDPQAALALLADREHDVALQEAVVERLRDLLDEEERELSTREFRVQSLRDALAKHGIEVLS